MRDKVKARRLFFLSVLFLMLLNFPLLAIFNKAKLVAGVPMLYLYMMLVWLTCIVAIGLFVERRQGRRHKSKI